MKKGQDKDRAPRRREPSRQMLALCHARFSLLQRYGWLTNRVMPRKYLPRADGSGPLQLLIQLEKHVRLIERCFDIDLPRVPMDGDVEKRVKGFCAGILEPCVRHEWKPAIRRRSLDTRVSVAASLFLFRKLVTGSEKPCLQSYLDKMTKPQDAPSSDYLSFVRKICRQLFPRGWDKGWLSQVDQLTPPTSACREMPRRLGGVRGVGLCRESFYTEYLDRESDPIEVDFRCDVTAVWTDKWRLVSKGAASRIFLRPLHKLIYDHLSCQNWLLRGEAEPGRFEGFWRKEGEVFVSGDYESATDNLNIHVSRTILKTIVAQGTHIPSHVKKQAVNSLTSLLSVDGVTYHRQERGQLMGNFLSFPLLCIANYLAFRYLADPEGKLPVRVNGDDIVFRASRDVYQHWADGVADFGLTLSRGKTLVSNAIFSLNSTFFRARRGRRVEALPFLRAKCLYPAGKLPNEVSGRLLGCFPAGKGRPLSLARATVLQSCSKVIWVSQRSVNRGLQGRSDFSALRMAGLYDRERHYLSLPLEPPLPSSKASTIPPGWVKLSCPLGAPPQDPLFYEEMVDAAWEGVGQQTDEMYWARLQKGTFKYEKFDLGRMARLLKRTPRFVREWADSRALKRIPEMEGTCWVKRTQNLEDAEEWQEVNLSAWDQSRYQATLLGRDCFGSFSLGDGGDYGHLN